MFGKIEKIGQSFVVETSVLELDWFNVPLSSNRTYVEVLILGIDRKNLETPRRLFTHLIHTSNDAGKYGWYVWFYDDFMEALGLECGAFLRFHVYKVTKLEGVEP